MNQRFCFKGLIALAAIVLGTGCEPSGAPPKPSEIWVSDRAMAAVLNGDKVEDLLAPGTHPALRPDQTRLNIQRFPFSGSVKAHFAFVGPQGQTTAYQATAKVRLEWNTKAVQRDLEILRASTPTEQDYTANGASALVNPLFREAATAAETRLAADNRARLSAAVSGRPLPGRAPPRAASTSRIHPQRRPAG